MRNPRLAGRYAKSLIDLATERGELDLICSDMRLIRSICKSNPDFVALLKSPIINSDTKGKIVATIIKDLVNVLTATFIQLLTRKGREASLPEIADAFIEQFNEIREIHVVKLTTAVPVSEELRDTIIQKIKDNSAIMKNIDLETAVNEELIGGFKLESGGKLIDATVLKDLKEVRQHFKDNEYIHKLR